MAVRLHSSDLRPPHGARALKWYCRQDRNHFPRHWSGPRRGIPPHEIGLDAWRPAPFRSAQCVSRSLAPLAQVVHNDRAVKGALTGAAHESRILEIDGKTVIFEINIIRIPVPRPFLRYRAFQAGRPNGVGVLASVSEYRGSVRQQFTDAELARLYRTASRLDHPSPPRSD